MPSFCYGRLKRKKILARSTLKTACDLHFVVHDNAIANSCMHTKSENGPSIRDVQCKQRTLDHNFRMSYTIWHGCVVKDSHRVKWHTHNVHNNCIYPPLHITFRNISAETIPHFVSHSGMLATKKISDHQQHKNNAAYRKGERVRREMREGRPMQEGKMNKRLWAKPILKAQWQCYNNWINRDGIKSVIA